jgi:hypothetical protein
MTYRSTCVANSYLDIPLKPLAWLLKGYIVDRIGVIYLLLA